MTRNQEHLLELSEQNNHILLQPRIPALKGSVEHYYHFLFDLLFPLILLDNKVESDVIFYLEPIGPFTEVVQEIFPHRVKIITKEQSKEIPVKSSIIGMNPALVELTFNQVNEVKNTLFEYYGIQPEHEPKRILLVERIPPSEFYLKEAKIKGAGASRRSILNHNEILEFLSKVIRDEYQFLNLQLEHVSFKEQLRLFSSTECFIGQHGAALANAVWMPKGATLLEFGCRKKTHFPKLSNLIEIDYNEMPFEDSHITVETKKLQQKLSSMTYAKKFFTFKPIEQ